MENPTSHLVRCLVATAVAAGTLAFTGTAGQAA